MGFPPSKQQLTLPLDTDVVDCFKSQGRGYQTPMNAVLRSFVNAQRIRIDERQSRVPATPAEDDTAAAGFLFRRELLPPDGVSAPREAPPDCQSALASALAKAEGT